MKLPPPPHTAPWVPPPASAPPKPRRSHKGVIIAFAVVVVVLLAALGGGAWWENVTLSSQYGPQRAVTDYFVAQQRGDVSTMMSNANFLQGDGAVSRYFNAGGLKAMLNLGLNRQIANVKVVRSEQVDNVTSDVTVALAWGDNAREHTYTVRMDPARVHDVFYHSWRVDIPSVSIHVELPKQPGVLRIDDMTAPDGSTTIQVIEGYHTVTMGSTDFYDDTSHVVAGFDGNASVTFDGKLSTLAVDASKAAISSTFALCPARGDCLNKTYNVTQKAGHTTWESWTSLPGYREIDAYKSWRWSLYGDPTAGMVLVVTNDVGNLDASGSCGMTLLVDGKRTYRFKGSWKATLTSTRGGFVANLFEDCLKTKA